MTKPLSKIVTARDYIESYSDFFAEGAPDRDTIASYFTKKNLVAMFGNDPPFMPDGVTLKDIREAAGEMLDETYLQVYIDAADCFYLENTALTPEELTDYDPTSWGEGMTGNEFGSVAEATGAGEEAAEGYIEKENDAAEEMLQVYIDAADRYYLENTALTKKELAGYSREKWRQGVEGARLISTDTASEVGENVAAEYVETERLTASQVIARAGLKDDRRYTHADTGNVMTGRQWAEQIRGADPETDSAFDPAGNGAHLVELEE